MENVPDTYMLMEKRIIRKALETLWEGEKSLFVSELLI